MNESRIMRIARGAGCHVGDVMEMLNGFKKIVRELKKSKKGMYDIITSQHNRPAHGMTAIQNLMRQMRLFGGLQNR